MMTDWYQKSINALTLNGKAERTQEAYTRAVRMLSEFYAKSPESITEDELEAYFLRRRNVDHWSANTMRICYCGIRFYFVQVLQRTWHLFDILRAKSESRLPAGYQFPAAAPLTERREAVTRNAASAPEPAPAPAPVAPPPPAPGAIRF